MTKRILIDVLVVLVLPVMLIFGYKYVDTGGVPNLLSSYLTDPTAPDLPAGQDLGAKTKLVLEKLNSIHFDDSIFTDPVFFSLVDFTQPISTSTIGRPYPFSTPDQLKAMTVNAKKRLGTEVSIPNTKTTIPVNASISKKLDAVKGSSR